MRNARSVTDYAVSPLPWGDMRNALSVTAYAVPPLPWGEARAACVAEHITQEQGENPSGHCGQRKEPLWLESQKRKSMRLSV